MSRRTERSMRFASAVSLTALALFASLNVLPSLLIDDDDGNDSLSPRVESIGSAYLSKRFSGNFFQNFDGIPPSALLVSRCLVSFALPVILVSLLYLLDIFFLRPRGPPAISISSIITTS